MGITLLSKPVDPAREKFGQQHARSRPAVVGCRAPFPLIWVRLKVQNSTTPFAQLSRTFDWRSLGATRLQLAMASAVLFRYADLQRDSPIAKACTIASAVIVAVVDGVATDYLDPKRSLRELHFGHFRSRNTYASSALDHDLLAS